MLGRKSLCSLDLLVFLLTRWGLMLLVSHPAGMVWCGYYFQFAHRTVVFSWFVWWCHEWRILRSGSRATISYRPFPLNLVKIHTSISTVVMDYWHSLVVLTLLVPAVVLMSRLRPVFVQINNCVVENTTRTKMAAVCLVIGGSFPLNSSRIIL